LKPEGGQRGPIAAIVLASTGEDIRNCGQCDLCSIELSPAMDMTIGELLQKAAQNDPSVFRSATLWHYDPTLHMDGRCQTGIDILRVIEAMREEAKLRGISP